MTRIADSPFSLSHLPAEFFENPYPWYERLRKIAPIVRDADGSLLLTRHADLAAVYRAMDRFSSDKRHEFGPKFGNGPLFEHHTRSLVFNDDPYHGRVRRRLVGALSPRAVERLGQQLASYCETLLDDFADTRGGDAIGGYAAAVPVRVIGDMLGVPTSARGPLRAWSLAILGALEPATSPLQIEAGNHAALEFSNYLNDLISERRWTTAADSDDLMARLLAAEESEPLGATDLVQNIIFLLNAGHETTTNLIGSALGLIAGTPGLGSDLAEGRVNIDAFVEEVLRFESPNQLGNRRAICDFVLSEAKIASETRLTLMIGAANRDPHAFSRPDQFDPHRSPNRHLAFGAGGHQCAGLSLARLEARVAILAWVRRFPHAEIVAAVRQQRVRFRGFERLDVRVSARS